MEIIKNNMKQIQKFITQKCIFNQMMMINYLCNNWWIKKCKLCRKLTLKEILLKKESQIQLKLLIHKQNNLKSHLKFFHEKLNKFHILNYQKRLFFTWFKFINFKIISFILQVLCKMGNHSILSQIKLKDNFILLLKNNNFKMKV